MTYDYVHQLLNMQFLLSSLGVRFQFHDALESNAGPIGRFTSHTKHLLRFVRPGAHKSVQAVGIGEMEYKSGYSFEEWLIFSGAPRALGQHPLTEAHRPWAGLLHNDMKANGIL
jgi:hypothetical protein